MAHEQGLGKTRTSIVTANDEMDTRTIVVCPASLKINWKREIEMVCDDKIQIIESGHKQRLTNARWIIINYDLLKKYDRELKTLEADTLIIDEAHYIKDDKTIRAKQTLALASKMERVYLLTGTPMLNRPIELYSLLRAVRHPLGAPRAKTAYALKFCGAVKKTMVQDIETGNRFFVNPKKAYPYYRSKKYKVFTFMDMKGATNLIELRESIKTVMQRRLKKDAIDLPDKIITKLTHRLTPEQRMEYDTAFDAYIEWLTNNPDPEKDINNILLSRHLVEIQKIKQVCSNAKIERIANDAKNSIEQGQKVIIFSQYTDTIKQLHALIPNSVTLTGENNAKERQASVDAFQNDKKTTAFISNIKAGGVGINLTSASIVMFADMDWSPEVHAQAEDRAHRIGQGGTVNVYYYVAEDTIEEDIMDMLDEKRKVIKEILGGDTETIRISTQKEMIKKLINGLDI